jgi:S-adenosylmethionine synthetase
MIKTAESVSPMHPDKICDRISDAIVDAYLKEDKNSRCAVEVMGGHELIQVMGEVTSNAKPDIREIVRRIAGNLECNIHLVTQSPEIAKGVDEGGAGDQGISVGYACNENEAFMPQEHYLSRSLCRALYELHPDDGKTQITINDEGKVMAIVASWRGVSAAALYKEVMAWIEKNNIAFIKDAKIIMNAAGDWEKGGFDADTGLTGRKIVVDAYGTRVPVGGGAFSGKDATKVDRSGAYRARQEAVRLLKERDAKEVTVYLAYAIGQAEPLQATAIIDGQEESLELERFKPQVIIADLQLLEPIYEQTAEWGHFGNGFRWDS